MGIGRSLKHVRSISLLFRLQGGTYRHHVVVDLFVVIMLLGMIEAELLLFLMLLRPSPWNRLEAGYQ